MSKKSRRRNRQRLVSKSHEKDSIDKLRDMSLNNWIWIGLAIVMILLAIFSPLSLAFGIAGVVGMYLYMTKKERIK